MDHGEELRYLILALQREGNRQLTEALRPLGLTPSQAEVLTVLGQYDELTLLQLGDRLVCETGSPSRLVASMVAVGWIDKLPNPADGRAVLLRLSGRGRDLLPAVRTVEAAFNAAAAAQVDAAALPGLIERLWAAAGASPNAQALLRRKRNE